MKFTKRFNDLLKQSSMSQTEIAKYLNISKQAISNLKNGYSLPSLYLLCDICKLFDCTSDYLLGLSDY